MSIQDLKYLKQNSRENSIKMYFSLNNLFLEKKMLNDLINNVFTIHILEVFINNSVNVNCILSVYANDIKMDSISINQEQNCCITGRDYEKTMINPLAKVTELTFKIHDFDNNEIMDTTAYDSGNICILIRNYEPQTEFNNNYNELNPQYNPHITLDYTSSDDEED